METHGFTKTLEAIKDGASLIHDVLEYRFWIEKSGEPLFAVSGETFGFLYRDCCLVRYDTTGPIDSYMYDHARFDSVYGEAANI